MIVALPPRLQVVVVVDMNHENEDEDPREIHGRSRGLREPDHIRSLSSRTIILLRSHSVCGLRAPEGGLERRPNPPFTLPIQYPKDKTNELRADMRITPRNSALGTTPFQNIRIRDRVTDI
jgi:hypothetical protein